MHVEARRWFQRTYGNTYHTVRVWKDGEVLTSGVTYGYGEHFWHTVGKMLGMDDPYDAMYLKREGTTVSVIDVTRKRDLHQQ